MGWQRCGHGRAEHGVADTDFRAVLDRRAPRQRTWRPRGSSDGSWQSLSTNRARRFRDRRAVIASPGRPAGRLLRRPPALDGYFPRSSTNAAIASSGRDWSWRILPIRSCASGRVRARRRGTDARFQVGKRLIVQAVRRAFARAMRICSASASAGRRPAPITGGGTTAAGNLRRERRRLPRGREQLGHPMHRWRRAPPPATSSARLPVPRQAEARQLLEPAPATRAPPRRRAATPLLHSGAQHCAASLVAGALAAGSAR